jgi:hypothetical protein
MSFFFTTKYSSPFRKKGERVFDHSNNDISTIDINNDRHPNLTSYLQKKSTNSRLMNPSSTSTGRAYFTMVWEG